MNPRVKEFFASDEFGSFIFILFCCIILLVGIFWSTDSKQWSIGSHDANCERNLYNYQTCNCHERLAK